MYHNRKVPVLKRPATRGMEVPCKYRFVGSPKELNKVESCLHGQTYKGDERSMKTPSEDVKKSLSVPAAVSIPTSQEKMPLYRKIVYHPYHNSQKAKQSTNKATARNGSITEDLR